MVLQKSCEQTDGRRDRRTDNSDFIGPSVLRGSKTKKKLHSINVQSIQYEIQNTIHTYNKEQYYTLPIYKYTPYKELHLK